MGICILLLTNFTENDADLVRDITDGLIASALSPLGKLLGNGHALAASRLVGANEFVFRLDELEELAAELGLDGATKGAKGKARLACR